MIFSVTPAEWEAVRLSLLVALWAVAGSLIPGLFVAWIFARKEFFGKSLLDSLLHLPLVLPPVVIGYLLLVIFSPNTGVGRWLDTMFGIRIAFDWTGAVVASATMAFPLLVRSIRLSIASVDQGVEQAARTLGAGSFRTFFTVTLPLIVPGLLTGMILAFARSLGEFGATITFVSNIPGQTRTLPLALYTATQVPGGETAAMRLCLISVCIALFALVISETFARRFAKTMAG